MKERGAMNFAVHRPSPLTRVQVTTTLALLNGNRPRRVRPMPAGVRAAHYNPFRIPPKIRPHIRRAITQSQSTSPSVRIVRFRPMQRQVAVDRNLPGPQNIIDWSAEPFDISNGLVEHIAFVVLAQTPGQVSVQVRSGNEA